MKKISQLGEFGWLRKLLPKLYWPNSHKSQLWIGPGDDAGALRISPGTVLVTTTDAMVEGIHFERSWFSWRDLGYKVLAVNLSDLAAMGDVKPIAALVTVAMPGDTPVDYVDKFYTGMHNCAQRWKTGFLGGDTVGSKKGWFVSVTLIGEARPERLIKRSGAKPGDYIVTTGPLGLAGAGLEVLQRGQSRLNWTRPLRDAFCRPEPRQYAGRLLSRYGASSLLDSSDGLEASVRILTEASHVGAEIDLDRLPMSKALLRWADKTSRHPWDYVLNGGEDYELVFTIGPSRFERLRRHLRGTSVIGRILPKGKGCWGVQSGRRYPLKGYGFAHFK